MFVSFTEAKKELVEAVVVDHCESACPPDNKSKAHGIHTEVAEIVSKSNEDVRKRVVNSPRRRLTK